MAFSENMSAADLAAVCGNQDGFGNGAAWWWIIILLLFANNGWGFGGNQGSYGVSEQIQSGFDQSAIMGGLNGLTSAVTNGFAGAEISRANQAMNVANQMNTIAMALQNGFCQNAASSADLKYTVATEACADRNAIGSALRDVLEANNAATQRILDQMCQDKIDAKNEQIANLQQQLAMANLAASQTAQTAQILADNNRQTVALEQYLNPAPIPAYVVQNPNCCSQNYGYGCGCGN